MRSLTSRLNLGLGDLLPLPEDIARQMKLWQLDLSDMPGSYIDWHLLRADEALRALLAECPGTRVVDQKIRNGEWFDGMREMHVIVETPSGQVEELVYCDSNQGFLLQTKAGQRTLFERDLA